MRPISALQERFWTLRRPAAATPLHNLAALIRLPAGLGIDALRQRLCSLADRHDALRVRFEERDGVPGIAIGDVAVDLEGGAAADRAEAEAEVRRETAGVRFDLGLPPLLRARVRTYPGGALLGLAVHRAVVDHASLARLVAELAEEGTGATGAAPSFASYLDDEVAGRSPDLFLALREEWAGAPAGIDLPFQRPRPAQPAYRGGTHRFALEGGLARRAGELAGAEDVSVDAVLLAAFQILLHRYSGQRDMVVGVELDRRPRPDAVGPFAELAPCRLRVPELATFRRLVGAAEEARGRALRRPPVPLSTAAEALRLRVGQPVPCAVAFALRRPLAGAWSVELLDLGGSEFDLELQVEPDVDGGLRCALVYDRDLLDRATVERMGEHLQRLLAGGLRDPDRPVASLAMLGRADVQLLTAGWNRSPDLVPVSQPAIRELEAWAARTPGAVALVSGERRLTYAELNGRANQLARVLRGRGAAPETVVAVCMARGPEMLIALVACLKAGAAPLLLDPATPTPRQELALAAAGAPVLALSLERLGARLPMPAERVLLLDRDRDLVAAYEATDLDVPVDLDNLAYLVQTSGSTGTPRCVGVTQRAFSHCSLQWRAIHRLGPGDRSSWLAPPGASVSQVEIWPYLMAGASVHVAEPQIVASPPDLRDWMIRSRITHAYVAMPLAEVLTSLDWGSDCALRVMSIGGDKVRRWAPAELPFEVGVNYGSAEACLVTHGWHPGAERTTSRTAGAEDRRGAPPIGRPGPGVRAYVLDDDLNLVPPGAVGELAVRTPEEARGYLGDPAKTALSFVPNPLGDPPGSRLYRTGDLASHRPDGLLDHRGRRDAQTKLRGHRVELAEIEAALLGHARVAGAVVVTRDDPAGVTRLVAYVVPRGPVAPDELRAFLAERLPEYMLPGSYVALDELPLNANRKVDRLSLPAPDWSGGRQRQPSAGPRNEIERAVVAIWVEQLRVPGVGIHDDFFQLGGDSLTGSLMVARLREQFGVDVSLRDVLLHPTPAGLAELVRGKPGRAPRRPLPTVVRRANGPAG